MTTNVLMSGPVRPSEEAVLEVIESIRRQLPNSRIFLSTWTLSPVLRSKVDFYQSVPEPQYDEIQRSVTQRTIQQTQLGLPDATPGCKISLYKMMYGVQCVCDLAKPHLKDSDKVIRIRTDSMFIFEPDYLAELLASEQDEYIAKKGDGFDWFAMTSFSNLKRTWCFETLQEYNKEVSLSWNPENLIARRVRVPVRFLEPSQVETYIIRENGRKHYYP